MVVKDWRVLTPPEGPYLLSGITRQVTLAVAQKADIPVSELPLREADLYAADEVFLTGTTIEVLPVARVDGRRIGGGAPGPVTRSLMARFGESRA
jgi:branched-subunit amino acid aminotransferase/4-amino-4-deoxychorismate lyase